MSLFLTNTVSTILVQAASTGSISVQASFADNVNGASTVTPGYQNTNIVAAVNTTVVDAPGASTARSIALTIKNTHTSVANLITVTHSDSTTIATLYSASLAPGEAAQYQSNGWATLDVTGATKITSANPASAYPQIRTIVSGTTDAGPTGMLAGNCLALWNSATGGAKTQTAPTAAGTNNRFTIVDVAQSASTSNITFTPATGVVKGNNKVATNGGMQTWVDTSLGWVAAL